MLFPAWRGRSRAPVNDDPELDYDAYAFEFDPGERIGPPPAAAGSSIPGAILIIVLMLAAGWGFMYAPADWLGMLGERVAVISALMRSNPPAAVASDPSTIATADAVIPAAPRREAHLCRRRASIPATRTRSARLPSACIPTCRGCSCDA